MISRAPVRSILASMGIAAAIAVTVIGFILLGSPAGVHAQSSSVRPPADAVTSVPPSGQVQPGTLPTHAAPGFFPSADMWRSVRQGIAGRVSIPDKKAGVLVQSNGENFRVVQNGPLPVWGSWLMLAMVVVLALFFALRGRIRVEGGFSGRSIVRFDLVERFAHWLVAVSFVVLALTGLNVLYGRYFLIPVLGPWGFAQMTMWGKYAHDYIAFAFMLGMVLLVLLWAARNVPTLVDLKWLAKGGGMFSKGTHVAADKFNAGQKILFWLVVLGAFSISFSGICLLFPFQFHPFAPTFKFFNLFGAGLPTDLTALQETQLALVWHGIVALFFVTMIIAHIYIGTLGMEGAFDAMANGKVDENWALQHHSLWYGQVKKAETEAEPSPGAAVPAE